MKTIIILLVIIVLNSIINKSIKAKKSASVREERKSTSAQRNVGDIKDVDNDDHRTFDDIDYDELIKVMPEEEIKRRYPSEYARHVNDMLLKQKQEEVLKRRKKEKAAQQNYKPRKEGERSTFENKPYATDNSYSTDNNYSTDNKATNNPIAADTLDLRDSNNARAAFIASEIFNRKYN